MSSSKATPTGVAVDNWYLNPLWLQFDVTLVPNTVTGTDNSHIPHFQSRRIGLEWFSWLAVVAGLMRLQTRDSLSCSPLKATVLWKTLF